MTRVKAVCSICKQEVALTHEGRFWTHGTPRCPMSRRARAGRPWRISKGKRRIVLVPGPDTWNPNQLEGAA
jgi:hypothetical protein